MKLDKNIDYSINLLRKAEPMALRLDPENGFYLAFSGGGMTRASTSSMPMKCCNRKLILMYERRFTCS